MFAPSLNELACCHHTTRMFFQTGGCDPSWAVLRIRLDERVEEHTGTFDVADLGVRFGNDAVE